MDNNSLIIQRYIIFYSDIITRNARQRYIKSQLFLGDLKRKIGQFEIALVSSMFVGDNL